MPFSRTEPNVPAYEEDPNSPFEVTQQPSLTVQLSESSNHVLVIADTTVSGFKNLRVNGVTGTDYDFLRRDGTEVTGDSEWEVPFGQDRPRLLINGQDGNATFHATVTGTNNNSPVSGRNFSADGPIDKFTLFSAGGFNRTARVQVFSLNI